MTQVNNHATGSQYDARLLKLEKDAVIMRVKMNEAYETINMLIKANEILINDLSYLYEKLDSKKPHFVFGPSKKLDDDTYN